MAGAPQGNQNAARGRMWREALNLELAQAVVDGQATGSVMAGLRAIAKKVVKAAIEGDQWSTNEIACRQDGKPAQAVILNGDEDGGPVRIQAIEIKAVDP